MGHAQSGGCTALLCGACDHGVRRRGPSRSRGASCRSITAPNDVLLARGPQIVEATAGGPLRTVKPFTPEVRANIDYELVDKSIDFMRRQKAAGKAFFLYLPFSIGHAPNLPAQQFKGKSRIGNYGDKLMEGDYHVGRILDSLKELGVDNDTIVVFASDNGPYGEAAREFGNDGTPDMGNSGPFRGELGEATEGAIRTCAIIRWPGHIKPNSTSYAMFSIMDFMPTFASIVGGTLPSDRPIDGVDPRRIQPAPKSQSRWRSASYSVAFGKSGVTWSNNARAVLRRHPSPAFRALDLISHGESISRTSRAVDPPPSCSRATRSGGSQRISPSCQSY
jgi:arylsulfatase A-like enzyme